MRFVRLVVESKASNGTCVRHSSALLYERQGMPDGTSKAAMNLSSQHTWDTRMCQHQVCGQAVHLV